MNLHNFMARYVIIGALATLISHYVLAQDKEVVNLGATITGNQEQPKVLYIVPWKQTQDNSILSKGLESRLSDVFDHVERSEHRREIQYFETLMTTTPSAEALTK